MGLMCSKFFNLAYDTVSFTVSFTKLAMMRNRILLFFVFVALGAQAQKVKLPKSWKLIPGGEWTDRSGKKIEITPFYIFATEITNQQYREFLFNLENSGQNELLEKCSVQSANWTNGNEMNAPYAEYYHKHPAFNDYPVVNVTHVAAVQYCIFIEATFEKSFPGFDFHVRLPSESEWMFAATGGNPHQTFAWAGSELKNKKGVFLANFRRGVQENIAGNLSEDLMAPSISYFPNAYKLYNMCGNVAEMIDTRGISKGGSYRSPPDMLKVSHREKYENSAIHIGFRPVLTYTKK